MIAQLRGLKPQQIAAAAFRLREIGLVVALGVAVVFFAVRATNFLSVENWQNIARDVAIVVVVGVGETMVVLTRNIDLSVASMVGLSAYISADYLADHQGTPLVVAALIAIGVGIVLGLVNGLLVVIARIPAIIATLATLAIYRGLSFHVTAGNQVSAFQLPDSFLNLAAKKPLGLPTLAWFALVVAIVGSAVLRWSRWGRDFYAIGSNPEAARFAGIPVGRRIILAFTICGALSGLGGFLWASRFPNVDAVAATDFELDVITAVVIGGVNVFGGSGSILGVVLGAVLVATIQDGFTLLRLSEFWKMFFNGAAIVVAVTLDALVTRRLQDALRRRRAEVLAARHAAASARPEAAP
ncbi:MAG TPA: ABC transporter permease [Gaiellaceae bacterium]|nr:ABC transporter permease [Gaiellaceae bacterium]